jgi:hypothetical protein
VDLISEHSENKNNLGEIIISHEKLATDSFLECKVHNISLEGMYVECDFPFGLKERVDLNEYNTVNHAKTDLFRFPGAKIKWKNDLQDSDFMYGYGIQFTEPFQSIEKIITNTKEKKQSIFLPSIFEIIGFTVFLAYGILRIFSGLKLAREPFELFIIGFGLISFAHIARIITKNFKNTIIEDKVINIKPAILQKEV